MCRGEDVPGTCLADRLAESHVSSAKFFDVWMDYAHIEACTRGAPVPTRMCANPTHRYKHYVANLVCTTCHACSDAQCTCEESEMLPRCADCGTFGDARHIARRRERPEGPCTCWSPYRLGEESWLHIPTPYLEEILKYQRFGYKPGPPATFCGHECAQVHGWAYAMMGRLRYPRSNDNWQVSLMIVGTAGTGKSTIADLVQAMYVPEDVGTMQARCEQIFGASALLTCEGGDYRFKPLLVAPEMSSEEHGMDQQMWQSIVSGDYVTVAIKNATAKTIKPDCQVVMFGNERMAYSDYEGQVSRRVVELEFSHTIAAKDKDGLLKQRLLQEELPFFIVKANRAYRSKLKSSGGMSSDIWSHLPRYFHDRKQAHTEEANVMKRFLREKRTEFVFRPDVYMRVTDLQQRFKTWCRAVMGRDVAWKKKTCEKAFAERGIVPYSGEKPWPPDDTDAMCNDSYLIGVSVSEDKGGWFRRENGDDQNDDMEEAVDELSQWHAAITDVGQNTQGPMAIETWVELVNLHWQRRGDEAYAKKVIGYMCARLGEQKDLGTRLLRDFTAFEAWQAKQTATTGSKRHCVG